MTQQELRTILKSKVHDLDEQLHGIEHEIETHQLDATEYNSLFQYRLVVKKNLYELRQALQTRDYPQGVGKTFLVELYGRVKEFKIVFPHLADPQAGLISTNSPMAQALLVGKIGDNVVVHTPMGDFEYVILSVIASQEFL